MIKDELIKKTLENPKTIAMVGVSSIKRSFYKYKKKTFNYSNEIYARVWL